LTRVRDKNLNLKNKDCFIIRHIYCHPIYGADKKEIIKLALAKQKEGKCG